MGQPRIVEVDYYAFKEKLKRASDAGGRIEKTDKEAWRKYIKDHGVSETSMQAWGKVKFMSGKIKLVAINHGENWDGFYAYSDEDEAALKWEPGESGTP